MVPALQAAFGRRRLVLNSPRVSLCGPEATLWHCLSDYLRSAESHARVLKHACREGLRVTLGVLSDIVMDWEDIIDRKPKEFRKGVGAMIVVVNVMVARKVEPFAILLDR